MWRGREGGRERAKERERARKRERERARRSETPLRADRFRLHLSPDAKANQDQASELFPCAGCLVLLLFPASRGVTRGYVWQQTSCFCLRLHEVKGLQLSGLRQWLTANPARPSSKCAASSSTSKPGGLHSDSTPPEQWNFGEPSVMAARVSRQLKEGPLEGTLNLICPVYIPLVAVVAQLQPALTIQESGRLVHPQVQELSCSCLGLRLSSVDWRPQMAAKLKGPLLEANLKLGLGF